MPILTVPASCVEPRRRNPAQCSPADLPSSRPICGKQGRQRPNRWIQRYLNAPRHPVLNFVLRLAPAKSRGRLVANPKTTLSNPADPANYGRPVGGPRGARPRVIRLVGACSLLLGSGPGAGAGSGAGSGPLAAALPAGRESPPAGASSLEGPPPRGSPVGPSPPGTPPSPGLPPPPPCSRASPAVGPPTAGAPPGTSDCSALNRRTPKRSKLSGQMLVMLAIR